MIRHYYTLYRVANEMQSIVGCRLIECFSQEKNSIVMNFSDGRNSNFVQFFGTPQNTSIFIRKNYTRARKNTVDLFGALIEEVLQDVLLLANNRIIQMDFINTKLFFLLFGGAKSNAIAVNRKEKIIDLLKSKDYSIGDYFKIPEPNLKSIEDLSQDTHILKALSRSDFNLGKYYAEEAIQRIGIESEKNIAKIPIDKLNIIKKTSEEIRIECLESKKYFILNTNDGLLLSLIRLNKYSEIIAEFESVSEAIYNRIITGIRSGNYDSLYKEIKHKLTKRHERILKNIENLRDEVKIHKRAKKYKLYAELLISHPMSKMKQGKQIILNDYEGKEISIPLDEKLTLMENANKFYDKARNTNQELKIRKKRLPDLELSLYKIENALKLLTEAKTYKELDKLQTKLKELTGIKMIDDSNDISTKFREFDLGEGYILYVGKNAANNDELTMKFAKPNDLWFHARGSGGSHVVLRLNKDQKPTKVILKKAASIAAYYSQARNAKYTPVAYTYKKYVRKPKGANIGSVIISKEDVIMVEPGLPEDN